MNDIIHSTLLVPSSTYIDELTGFTSDKRFMMSFKLAMHTISECLPAGHGKYVGQEFASYRIIKYVERVEYLT
jgi:hypothetical protein